MLNQKTLETTMNNYIVQFTTTTRKWREK